MDNQAALSVVSPATSTEECGWRNGTALKCDRCFTLIVYKTQKTTKNINKSNTSTTIFGVLIPEMRISRFSLKRPLTLKGKFHPKTIF